MSRGFSLRDYLRTATALPNGLRAEQSATNGVDDQTPLRAELSSTSGARPSTFCSDPIEALGRQRLSFVRHWSQTCHRAIKRGCAFMLGFKSFANAAIRSLASSWRIGFTSDSARVSAQVRSTLPGCQK